VPLQANEILLVIGLDDGLKEGGHFFCDDLAVMFFHSRLSASFLYFVDSTELHRAAVVIQVYPYRE
jgi:hypothetical protein